MATNDNMLKIPESKSIIDIRDHDLENSLSRDYKVKSIRSEQWFRDFSKWLLVVFNSPYNFKHPNSELILLYTKRNEIFPCIKNTLQVFYGVGVCETELEILRWQIEECNIIENCAIDINKTFLELFVENLKQKSYEYPEATILGQCYNRAFQDTSIEDFSFHNRMTNHATHICVGGSIGNYKDSEEIWSIFKRNMKEKDRLLLGFQLNTNIDIVFESYRHNEYMPNLILNYLDGPIEQSKIEWHLDRKTHTISMYYGEIEAFRAKKFAFEDVKRELDEHNFTYLSHWKDEYENSCIAIFEKLG